MIDVINMIVVPCMEWRRNLECGDKSRAVRGSRHRFLSALCAETHLVLTLAQKAASRGIPLAAALQILPSRLRSRRHPVKISAPLRLCVKKLSTLNAQLSTLKL
jgi:hypothetical protein